MAKSKPADNQFTVGEKYLARILAARWNSIPTVGAGEVGLIIQIKLSILCAVNPDGVPGPCACEVVIYIVPTISSSGGTLRISKIANKFLDELGVSWPQGTDRGSSLQYDTRATHAIICEFGPGDSVNGFQSIVKWERITDASSQQLIAQALQTGTTSRIIGLKFPQKLIVTRHTITEVPVKLRSIRDWNVLRLLAENSSYRGIDLVQDVWTATQKEIPEEIEDTVYGVISRLKKKIACLSLDIENDRNGNYSLEDIANS